MRQALILLCLASAPLWPGGAAAQSPTPIVPNDVGHWLNLEYRNGTLAPQILDHPEIIRSLLVVDRSLGSIDDLLRENPTGEDCHGVRLPYQRLAATTVSETDENGVTTVSTRTIRRREELAVRVCSTVDQRFVLWLSGGDLMIVARSRTDIGHFPRTLYSVYQVSAADHDKWIRRKARAQSGTKKLRPPKVALLYDPPGEDSSVRTTHPFLTAFSAEFQMPLITAGTQASRDPVDGRPSGPTHRKP